MPCHLLTYHHKFIDLLLMLSRCCYGHQPVRLSPAGNDTNCIFSPTHSVSLPGCLYVCLSACVCVCHDKCTCLMSVRLKSLETLSFVFVFQVEFQFNLSVTNTRRRPANYADLAISSLLIDPVSVNINRRWPGYVAAYKLSSRKWLHRAYLAI